MVLCLGGLTGVASRWQAHGTVSSQLCWYNARPQTGRASAAEPDASHHMRHLLSSRDPLVVCPHHPQYHPQQQQQRHTCACGLPTAPRPRTRGRTRRGSQLPAAGVRICTACISKASKVSKASTWQLHQRPGTREAHLPLPLQRGRSCQCLFKDICDILNSSCLAASLSACIAYVLK